MAEMRDFAIKISEKDTRLDKYLAEVNPDLSRTYIKQLIAEERVKVNQIFAKASQKLKPGDEVIVDLPSARELDVSAEEIPLNIIYEDQQIVVVNKPADMVVHPAPGNATGTLVNALLHHCDRLAGINGILRPGIVHRLDKDTSGVLVVAKTDLAQRVLVEQFKARQVKKIYLALIKGYLPYEEGTIDAPIGRDLKNRQKMAVVKANSKSAITHFTVQRRFRDHTWLRIQLETGRTHQIRVHFSYIGYPLVGDDKYGQRRSLVVQRQMLHAHKLTIDHPKTGVKMTFTAPLSQDMKNVLQKLCLNQPTTS